MALLDRVLQRGPSGSSPEDFDDARMTILEHLQDLRRVLIVSMIAWALGTAIAFAFWPRILEFLIQRGAVKHLVYLGPPGALTLGLKIALFVGIVVAAPVWIQQLWWFVSPGLHQKEKRLILPLILATIAFFAIGVAFALFSLPLFLRILNGFAPPDLSYLGVADEYISFVLLLVVGFGIVFELPIVIFVLGLIGVIKSKWLYRNRFYWIIGLGVISNLLTPGVDPITPLFMWVPLYLFWEATALLLKLLGK
ncbi:MAG: twin-arginine translocase subunit TatC [Chloroflexi bacterium]|nr:MAG: twin-arginine translocase subunit TatC [Chloroflexota bacterium]